MAALPNLNVRLDTASDQEHAELDILDGMDTDYSDVDALQLVSNTPDSEPCLKINSEMQNEIELIEDGEIVGDSFTLTSDSQLKTCPSNKPTVTLTMHTKESVAAQRAVRAKRFDLDMEMVPHEKLQLSGVYKSLNLKSSDLEPGNLRGIRPEAVHVRGVNQLSSDEVLVYFKDFSPASVEWIDDNSCNVIWQDAAMAARAMMNLSTALPTPSHAPLPLTKVQGALDAPTDGSSDNSIASIGDDTFDLTRDDGGISSFNTKMEGCSQVTTTTPKNGRDAMLSGGDASSEQQRLIKAAENAPPGHWRLGRPHPKAARLFLRFATKADKKLAGAERRTQQHPRNENPRYGEAKGLTSESLKKKMKLQQDAGLPAEVPVAAKVQRIERSEGRGLTAPVQSRHHEAALVMYDDLFGDLYEETGEDELPAAPAATAVRAASRSDVWRRGSGDDSRALKRGSGDSEVEGRDSPPPAKRRPAMKMRADEEEERALSRRLQLKEFSFDARTKISGSSRIPLTRDTRMILEEPVSDLRAKLRAKHS